VRDTWIIGAAATQCGRFPDADPGRAGADGCQRALSDAGVGAEQIEAVFFANALEGSLSGQECIRRQVALHAALGGAPIVNVENACASGSTALHLARLAVAGAAYETVLVVGAEKKSHPDRMRPLAALEGATDVATLEPGTRQRSIFMDTYAGPVQGTGSRRGEWTPADPARIVVKNRRHAAANAIAQYRAELTVEEVLASRPIVEPLTLPMCSPIGDAAAALVVTGSPPRRSGAV
jgi:acetyl-CoA acetyltransferase